MNGFAHSAHAHGYTFIADKVWALLNLYVLILIYLYIFMPAIRNPCGG